MFDTNSRYAALDTAEWPAPDGRTIQYKRRRFPPARSSLPLLGETIVKLPDRLDQIADRSLGDALAFWRICDANNALDPLELTAKPDRRLIIPLPQP